MRWVNYLWRAFNARPFGMPVPPLWFALIISGLLGFFITPAFALFGVGATIFCTGAIANSRRFQLAIDAGELAPRVDEDASLLQRLDNPARARQTKIEQQCAELQKVLENAKAGREHIAGVWQLAKLHLRLLAARSSALAVTASQESDARKHLSDQLEDVKKRLAATDLDDELRQALDDQSKILEQRIAMQKEAGRRLQVLDAELERISEQIALIREQALLATDPASIGRSVDSLAAFLNESGKWLQDQEDIFGGLDDMTPGSFAPGTTNSSQHAQRGTTRLGESQ